MASRTEIEAYENVRPGDRVVFLGGNGERRVGRVWLIGPAGPVVSVGKRFGSPEIVARKEFVTAWRK